jgi:AAA domain, putative AbiEii toxin, Type IV TA system
LTFDSLQRTSTTSEFKQNFPAIIYSFPTLGPIEEEEELLTDKYVQESIGTRRSHRMLRNIWYRWPDIFPIFRDLVERTWDGMSISPPELDTTYPAKLTMFCKEGRVDREVFWAGFGFQVWLQILTHLANSAAADVLVIDEPEIYLHPELQHKLFHLLKATDKQIILATHSAEMVKEAEHEEVILVNKTRKLANRVTDIEGLQEALFSIGSAQNIHLARLSRGKKILFLEGNDFRLLKRFASHYGYADFANDVNITVVPIGGFSQRQKIQHASWTFEKVLRAEIAIAGLLDRDYRSKEEIDEILKETRTTVPHFHILDGKEIENYLLVPSALTHAVNDRLKERKAHESVSEKYVVDLLLRLADEMKSSVLSQWISNRMRFFDNRTSKDPATVAEEAIANLDKEWHSPRARLMVVPGKSLLSAFNTEIQNKFGISITSSQIIRHLDSAKIALDLKGILHDLNEFAKAPPPGTLIKASH